MCVARGMCVASQVDCLCVLPGKNLEVGVGMTNVFILC